MINKDVTELIYLQKVFDEILINDPTKQYTNIRYGKINKHTQPPSINKTRKALGYLELNEYASKNSGAPIGWIRVEDIRGEEGFRATVFKKNGELVIAYIGAEVGVSDWISDGVSQSGEIDYQYTQALELAQRYLSDFPNLKISTTGYSLGGALATYAGLIINKEIITFNHLSLNKKSIKYIKNRIELDGYNSNREFRLRVKKILNISFRKEFVTDSDNQEDGDGLFNHEIIGDIYYIDDKRFKPLLLDNKIFRHLLPPLKEELQFLSNPFYRVNSYNLNSDNNSISSSRARWYIDYTLDDFDILFGVTKYTIDSLPSLIEDIKKYYYNHSI